MKSVVRTARDLNDIGADRPGYFDEWNITGWASRGIGAICCTQPRDWNRDDSSVIPLHTNLIFADIEQVSFDGVLTSIVGPCPGNDRRWDQKEQYKEDLNFQRPARLAQDDGTSTWVTAQSSTLNCRRAKPRVNVRCRRKHAYPRLRRVKACHPGYFPTFKHASSFSFRKNNRPPDNVGTVQVRSSQKANLASSLYESGDISARAKSPWSL